MSESERSLYLRDVPLDEARVRFEALLERVGYTGPLPGESIAPAEALDRVAAAHVPARLSSPHYHACAMDGIAVLASRTAGASEASPVRLRLGTEATSVDTGDPLPAGCDAVVMAEVVESLACGELALRAPVAPWEHVRPIGEDLVATELVVAAGDRLRPVDLAALSAAGIARLDVVRRPRVAVITTGSELVAPETDAPRPGEILDSNAVLLAACVEAWGGIPVVTARVPDDRAALAVALDVALAGCDVVVVNAGSSAGREDFTARVIAERGEVVVHGVAIRPGHPLILGAAHGKPILGIPGYPVSAALCAELFLRPLLERLGGRGSSEGERVEVRLARKLFSPLGEEEYVRAVVAPIEGVLTALPLKRGAAVITSLARANALLLSPRESEGYHEGECAPALLLRSRGRIERTLLAAGSHDVALDALSAALRARGYDLVSSNIGSIAGLVSLKRRACHLAGTHVLDPGTGTFNDAAVARYCTGERVALIGFVDRSQGLIVTPGNPLHLTSIADVARERARFVNRQRDSGTRILLDYLLAKANLEPAAIDGYERIEFTHTAVAALVRSGAADCGLGILAAAQALGCGFVPIADERYELATTASRLEEEPFQALLEVLRGPELPRTVAALGGYGIERMGEIRMPNAAL
ncbi:molybdopterin biosynthesis protein [bacterium]|nr:MAG: molybdopterin biosynthesis protein [bacterium]